MDNACIITYGFTAVLGGAMAHTGYTFVSSIAVAHALRLPQLKLKPSRFRFLRELILRAHLRKTLPRTTTPTAATPRYTPELDTIRPVAAEVLSGCIVGTCLDEAVVFNPTVTNNPHLLISGLSGMGKTTLVNNIVTQMLARGITPIVFSFADDLEEPLNNPRVISATKGLQFNPLTLSRTSLDAAASVRDAFKFIYPSLGDLQLAELYAICKDLSASANPTLDNLVRALESVEASSKVIARIQELDDYKLFSCKESRPLLEGDSSIVVRLWDTDNQAIQRALQAFALIQLYLEMKRRGPQSLITHAIIIDEAHLLSRLPFLAKFAREARKYGLSLILASQSTTDFSDELYSSIGNYIALRSDAKDAYLIAKRIAPSTKQVVAVVDELKDLPKFFGLSRLQDGKLRRVKLAKAMPFIKPQKASEANERKWLSRVEICDALKIGKSRFYEAVKNVSNVAALTQTRSIDGRPTNYYSSELLSEIEKTLRKSS